MKRLSQALAIGPKYVAQFEQQGVRTLDDLAKVQNLAELSLRTEIPLQMVQEWHDRAKQKLRAAKYRRRIAVGIAVVVLLVVGWELRALRQSPSRLSDQANALYDKGDYEEALKLYDKVIQKDPTYELAYANRGGALHGLDRYSEALTSLNKAIELNPQDVWAYNERGNVYSDTGDHERAIADYDKAIEIDPSYKFAYSKATDLQSLGRFQEAADALTQGIAVDPNWSWAYHQRGSIYHDDLFQFEAAYRDLKKASEIDDSSSVDADLAEAALSSGRYKEAYDLATKLRAANEQQGATTWDASDRLAVRLIAVSALLLEPNRRQAKAEAEEFVKYYESVAPSFKQHWVYSGTQHFIATKAMDSTSKSLILELIKLIQQPPGTTADRVQELISHLK